MFKDTFFYRTPPVATSAPIEWSHYGAKCISRKDLCTYCEKTDSAADKKLKKSFKTVLPFCNSCKASGKDNFKRRSLDTT